MKHIKTNDAIALGLGYNPSNIQHTVPSIYIIMTELNKDIFISALFMGGIFGFVSGAFVVSSALFVTVAAVNSLSFHDEQTEEI